MGRHVPGKACFVLSLLVAAMIGHLAPVCRAYTLFPAGGFQGYTYNKWGGPELGSGAQISWSLLPSGTPGSIYCGEACAGSSSTQLRVWNSASQSFVLTELTTLQPIIEDALRTWSRSANISFIGPVGDSGIPINDPAAIPPATAEVRIGVFSFTGNAQFYGGVGFAPPPNGGTGEGDILLNAANYFQINDHAEGLPYDLFPPGGGPFMNDLEGLVLHELGHALGLAHPNNLPPGECSVMSIDVSCFTITNHIPDRDDLLGIRALYGFSPDLDGNGEANCGDLDQVTAAIVAANPSPFLDLNGDGVVTNGDRDAWLASSGRRNLPSGNPYRSGDANLDGVVDGSDFNIWNSNKFTIGTSWCRGDFNTDGSVDGSDFNIWNSNKFTSSDAVGVVPEPTSLVYLAAGIVVAGGKKRRAGDKKRVGA